MKELDWLTQQQNKSTIKQKIESEYVKVAGNNDSKKSKKLGKKLLAARPRDLYNGFIATPKPLYRFINHNWRHFKDTERALLLEIIDRVFSWNLYNIRYNPKKLMNYANISKNCLMKAIVELESRNIIKKEEPTKEEKAGVKTNGVEYRINTKKKLVFNPYIDTWIGKTDSNGEILEYSFDFRMESNEWLFNENIENVDSKEKSKPEEKINKNEDEISDDELLNQL